MKVVAITQNTKVKSAEHQSLRYALNKIIKMIDGGTIPEDAKAIICVDSTEGLDWYNCKMNNKEAIGLLSIVKQDLVNDCLEH